MKKTWRDHARPIIAAVIEKVGTADTKALRAALCAAYPFGEKAYHPYKIWCSEINVQLGKKKFGDTRKKVVPCKGQGELFDESDAKGITT